MDLELERTEDPTPQDVRELEDRLYEFNREATGIRDGRGLGFFRRGSDGALEAGVIGHSWGGCCEISLLWVSASLRGRGLGRRLMQEVEAEARRRGCHQILVTTHSFQAPAFYRKLGYEELYEFAEYPRGHSELTMCKQVRAEV